MRIPFFSGRRFSALLLCFFLLFVGRSIASVLAIDYGTEWTKAALVKPGISMQIVLTKDSKRKEQSVVGFKNQERAYGADGINLVRHRREIERVGIVLMVCVGSAISRGHVSFVKGIIGEINRLGCCQAVSQRTPRN